MISPDRLDAWRRTAALDARSGTPVGNALLDACNEVERLQAEMSRTVAQASDHIGNTLRRLTETEVDRDRARDAAVALEQENARVRAYAERCARSGNRAYAKAGRELLTILDGGEH